MNLLPFDRMNRLHLGDCVAGMRTLPDGCIPLTVTSPPYDNLREYGGHTFDFGAVARELWRVTAPGGVLVWFTQDQTVGGGQTGTGCRQQLFLQDIGFRVYERIVMDRINPLPRTRHYSGVLEIAVVLSKGRPRSVNLLCDKPNRQAGAVYPTFCRSRSGRVDGRAKPIPRYGVRGVVWRYTVGGPHSTADLGDYAHPSVMPEAMAEDHIRSWSRPGDVVLDPFLGSGTTAKIALLNDRRYLGYEVHEPYFGIAHRRLADAREEYSRRLDEWLAAVGRNRSSGNGV